MSFDLSLIIPANNEAAHIGACLRAVLASHLPNPSGGLECIVAANGCNDETVEQAQSFTEAFRKLGWDLKVLDLPEGGKLKALNAADAQATGRSLAYLDADVRISPKLLQRVIEALGQNGARYATGRVHLSDSPSWITRAYGRFYAQTPFMQQNAPGCGFFAMTRAGRARWNAWPAIISDDTFARLSFAPNERREVEASYEWPLVDGFGNLVRVRRRQNAGVHELNATFPGLAAHDTKPRFAPVQAFKAALRAPLGAMIYGAVALIVKLTPGQHDDWRRGR